MAMSSEWATIVPLGFGSTVAEDCLVSAARIGHGPEDSWAVGIVIGRRHGLSFESGLGLGSVITRTGAPHSMVL